jgi:hypothetical protein
VWAPLGGGIDIEKHNITLATLKKSFDEIRTYPVITVHTLEGFARFEISGVNF